MKNFKVSIVVPVYKVESYIKRCVDSLINQTLKEIEIILVDDGSPDKCPQICDDYSKQDNRIKVIHKKNGGLSDARNVGLLKSSGEYILFIDSDDYIKYETCDILYLNAIKDNLDLVVGDAIRIENNTEIYMQHSEISLGKISKGTEFLKEQLKYSGMYMSASMNLYKKDFLVNNELLFKKGIYHEDEQWTPRVFLIAERVKYVKIAFYCYIIRENSITKKKDKSQNGRDMINTCYELEKIYKRIEDKELKKLLNNYLVMLFLNGINIGDLYSQKYSKVYNKKFLFGKSTTIKNRLKVGLFILNKHLYKILNAYLKRAV